MGRLCNFYALGVIAVIVLAALVWLYMVFASPSILILVVVPSVPGAAFLAIWVLTTATGLTSHNKPFAIIYILTVAVLALAAWWANARDSAPAARLEPGYEENHR